MSLDDFFDENPRKVWKELQEEKRREELERKRERKREELEEKLRKKGTRKSRASSSVSPVVCPSEFTLFEGATYEQMPKLIDAGLVPANMAQIMLGYAAGKLSFEEYHDSGDAIAYHPDGPVKIVLDAKPLRELTSQSELLDGGLILLDGAWESLEGEVFTRSHIQTYANRRLTNDPDQKNNPLYAKSNPFWREFARGQELHKNYVDGVSRQLERTHRMMKIVISDSPDTPLLRLWCLGGVDNSSNNNSNYGGGAGGYKNLDGNFGRLAGVLETQSVSRPENQRFSVAPEARKKKRAREGGSR